MILQKFMIHDSKLEAFIRPFYSPTVGVARRSFGNAVNDPTTDFAKNPGDYTLFHTGEFDESTGDEKTLPAKINLGLAINYTTSHEEPAQPGSMLRGIQGGE